MTACIFSRAFTRLQNPDMPDINGNRSKGRSVERLFWMLLPMLLCCPPMSIAANPSISAASANQIKKPVEFPIKYASVLYSSGNHRDPFINPLLGKKKTRKPDDEEVSRGTPPPGIAGTYIAQATLHGIASRNSGKVAVFRAADSRAYFLRKGDRLFDGYVKEINDDSVTLVRETRMRSGKTLTQDVTKRLRTP